MGCSSGILLHHRARCMMSPNYMDVTLCTTRSVHVCMLRKQPVQVTILEGSPGGGGGRGVDIDVLSIILFQPVSLIFILRQRFVFIIFFSKYGWDFSNIYRDGWMYR